MGAMRPVRRHAMLIAVAAITILPCAWAPPPNPSASNSTTGQRPPKTTNDNDELVLIVAIIGGVIGLGCIIAVVFMCFFFKRGAVHPDASPETSGQNYSANSTKKFGAFLSHSKRECATEARYIKDALDKMVGKTTFLDSDDLTDLRTLLATVHDSDCLVMLLSKGVLSHPWCLLELTAAIDAQVPIVAVNVEGRGYCFAEAIEFLMWLDTTLEIENPGATNLLIDNGHDVIDVAYKMSTSLPYIIAKTFDPLGSNNYMEGFFNDLVEMMAASQPLQLHLSKEEWLAARQLKRQMALPARDVFKGESESFKAQRRLSQAYACGTNNENVQGEGSGESSKMYRPHANT